MPETPETPDYDQAPDERTFDDLLLHLKKADALMNLVFEGQMNLFDKDKTLHQALEHTIRAWNTAAYLQNQESRE